MGDIGRPDRAGGGLTLFLIVAAAVHAGGLVALAPEIWRVPPAEEMGGPPPVAGASPELAALVEAWNTPPETGEAAALDGPAAEAPPPDTSTAAVELAAVDAQDAVEDLGPVSGPGKEAVRPIFAPKIKTKTAAPARVVFAAEGTDAGTSGPEISAPEPPRPSIGGLAPAGGAADGSGINVSGSDGAVSGSLAGLGAGEEIGAAALSLPVAPIEESMAPETSPLPLPRPYASELARQRAMQPADEDQPSIVIGPADPEDEAEDPQPVAAIGDSGPGLSADAAPMPALPGAALGGPGSPGSLGPATGGLGAPALPGGGQSGPTAPEGTVPALPPTGAAALPSPGGQSLPGGPAPGTAISAPQVPQD